MKKVLDNLKVYISYYVSFAVYFLTFEFFCYKWSAVCFYIIFSILLIICWYANNFKNSIYGLAVFELQMIICPIIFSLNTGIEALQSFSSSGNIMYSTFKPVCETVFQYDISVMKLLPDYIISIIYPVLFILTGSLIKQKVKKKKPIKSIWKFKNIK